MKWMKRTAWAFVALCTVGCAKESAPRTTFSPQERDALALYNATHGYRLGRPRSVTLLDGGQAALYLRSGDAVPDHALYHLDAATGDERLLATAETLLGVEPVTTSAQEAAEKERQRSRASGITSYEVSHDERSALVSISGRLFVLAIASERHRELEVNGHATNAHFSPDDRWVSYVAGDELHVVSVNRRRRLRLTRGASDTVSNGTADFIAQEEMGRYEGYWWSPDSQQIAFQRTDNAQVQRWYRADPRYPEKKPLSAPYPRAGTENADVRLGIVSIGSTRTTWVQWDRQAFPYLARVVWGKRGPLTLVVQDRLQQREQVLVYDPRTKRVRTLLEETSNTWINIDRSTPAWLPGGTHFLWTTERNGAWELELRASDGTLTRTIVGQELGYRWLIGIDDAGKSAWLLASGEPTEQHVYRVSLAGGPTQKLTSAAGSHYAGDLAGTRWVLEERGRDGQWGTYIMDGDALVRELPSTAAAPPVTPDVSWRQIGKQRIRTAVIRPRAFDSSATYPVLVSVYGGPGFNVVHAFPHAYHRQQFYADAGYIVVMFDGRGTPWRGAEWERAIYKDVIDIPLTDQAEALALLQKQVPQLDLDRVGIYGWSFGGYFAAMAVMKRPDTFHAAVAGAPGADWRDYDTHYTERYLGLPQDNAAAYDNASLLMHAPKLGRPLLIVHGTLDDNVYFTHAVKLSDALFRAGKPHELLPLSGSTHMVGDAETATLVTERILAFFDRHLRAGTP